METPILGRSAVDLPTAQRWARARGAANVFIAEMLPALMAASTKTGVRFEVLAAQSAHETGLGNFGRAVTLEHHNTAGIKVPHPGADDAADSHERFPSWRHGAEAHANHLRWPYCGEEPIGYVAPRSRYTATASWAGTVTTVEGLSGKWAPSSTYHVPILRNIGELINLRKGFVVHHNGPPANCVGQPHSRCERFWEGVKRYHGQKFGSKWAATSLYSFGICLPLDTTEVLTTVGWLPLGDINGDHEVASWSPDSGSITFDKPLGYTPTHTADVISVHKWEMTPDHRMYTRGYWRRDAWKEVSASEVKPGHVIPAAGELGATGLPINDDLLRLLAWVQADGSYIKRSSGVVGFSFHLVKDRKIKRIIELLDRLGLTFTVRPCHGGQHTKIRVSGHTWIRENIVRWLPEKKWTWEILGLSRRQVDVLMEDVAKADAVVKSRSYCSSEPQNVDVIQALCVLNGRKASLTRVQGGRCPEVSIDRENKDPWWTWTPNAKPDKTTRSTLVGCLTTVNGTLIIRQRGQAAIVGNCPHGEVFVGCGWLKRQAANGSDVVGEYDGNDSQWYTVLAFVGGGAYGGFDTGSPEEPVTPEMKKGITDLILAGRRNEHCGDRVLPHNAFKKKACPGPTLTHLAKTLDRSTPATDPFEEDEDMAVIIVEAYALWRDDPHAASREWKDFRWWLQHGRAVGVDKLFEDIHGAFASAAGF